MTNEIDTNESVIIDCENLEKFIIDFLDDELPIKIKLSFLQHIEECEHCEKYLQEYRKTINLSKAAFAESEPVEKNEMPEELMDAILTAIHKS